MTHNLTSEELGDIKDLIRILRDNSCSTDETISFPDSREETQVYRLAIKIDSFIR